MRLFIGDSELDIAPDELPAFTFSISDIIEVDKIRGARSTTMMLPVTAENRRALGGYSMSEVALAQGREIKVMDGTAVNFTGKAIVTRRSDKELELVAVGNNAAWANDLKGVKIGDLDLGIMERHSGLSVVASWTADTLHVFPLIDYGTLEGRDNTYAVPLTMVRPALRVSRVIENALGANDWTIDWNGSLGNFIDKVIMPDTSDALKVTASQFDDVKATAAISVPVSATITPGTAYTLSPALVVDNEISDPGGHYNPGTYVYTSPFNMTISPKVTATIIVTSPTASGGVYLRMGITGAAQYTLIQPSLTQTIGGNVVRYYNLDAFPMSAEPISAGDLLNVNLYFTAFTGGGTVDVNDFQITWEAAAIGYQAGVDVDLNSVNPDTSILDLVNWLATTYNIVMRTEGRRIQAWTYDEFYTDPALGTGLDISERVTGDTEKHTETVPKRYEFRHKEDNKDRLLAEYQALYGLNYGDADSEIPTGYDDPYEVKVGYAPTVSAFVLDAFSVPALRDIDGVATAGEYPNRYKWATRLLYFEGVGDGQWKIEDEGTLDTYPIVYAAGARGTVLFGDTPEAGAQGTVDRYWRNRLRRVGAPVANALVYWHDHEIANLDPGRPVWVHDGQHGGWYYVSEVKQHRFGMGVPAETILIPV